MIDLATLAPPVQAGLLVGAVLVEAIVLYVGFGAIERVAGERVIETVTNA